MERTHEITIQTDSGDKTVHLAVFPAMDGYDIRKRLPDYHDSSKMDGAARRSYLIGVCSYAFVMEGEDKVYLASQEAINEKLGSWVNLDRVFAEVLNFNGIDPYFSELDRMRAELQGAHMATGFAATATRLLGDLIGHERAAMLAESTGHAESVAI